MLKSILKRLFLLLGLLSLTSCTIDRRHVVQKYDDYQNADIVTWNDFITNETTWDNVSIHTFDESDEVCAYVYSQLLFDGISDEFASVAAIEVDYKSNGQYFNGDLVYELVGNQFDLNPLITKFAIGTAVIVVCVIISVATYGAGTPVACFFAGAAKGAIDGALVGAAMGAATGAVTSYIKSNGDWEKTLYGTAEGSTDGYMWGAIFGAISGGLNSKVCFTEETQIYTTSGYKNISEVKPNDYIYSYNNTNDKFSFCRVTEVHKNVANNLVVLGIGNELIRCTPEHPFLTTDGWIRAANLNVGDHVRGSNNSLVCVTNKNYTTVPSTNVYNLTVENNHTYTVGRNNLVVHNVCAKDFAGDTYHFPDGSPQASKYPNGIRVDSKGFPRFEEYALKEVKFPYPSLEGKASGTCLTGNSYSDFKLANKLAGFDKTPAGYTWHHVEDMQTMLLVPQDIHSFMYGGLRHQGGASLIRIFFQLLQG